MKLRLVLLLAIISLSAIAITVWGQADSVIGQFTNSLSEANAGGISGDGRFVVFASRGDLATENPRNADNNLEIFLWDYAQRRIFQITNTKSVLTNPFGDPTVLNIRVEIINKRPVISNDGRWIAFASNAYATAPCTIASNPGDFDGNACTSPSPTPTPTGSPSPTPTPTSTPNNNPLITDANLEIWMYQVPATAPADLTSGEELPITDLATGTFTRVTDTPASLPPQPASSTALAFVADDNHDPSISDHGEAVSFTSTRDLISGFNTFPTADNEEIFVYRRAGGGSFSEGSKETEGNVGGGTISQVTITPRGAANNPIYNKNSSISGDGTKVVFASKGDDPVPSVQPVPVPSPSPLPSPPTPFDCGSNPSTSRNEEVFYVTLNTAGAPTACRQITTTTPTNPGDPTNILDLGRRISRDGRFVAFDSYADLAGENSGTNYTSFATYVFDANVPVSANPYKRVLPRSDADSQAAGGDVPRFPGFTDYDLNGTPFTIVLETRLNIKPDGTIATTASEGLNPDAARPSQIYKTSQSLPAGPPPGPTPRPPFTRITKFPISSPILAFTQPLTSNTSERLAFDLPATELGTGNPDGQKEVYYLYLPPVINPAVAVFSFATGASRMPVTASPVPTPSPTATPSPTPTATPTPTPTPGGSPTPTPTPVPTPTPMTPPAVLGLSPGSLAILAYSPSTNQPLVARTAVGSIDRSFMLPIELSGVSMTINGVACGLKSVSRREIVFVVPPFLSSAVTGTPYPVVINNNGTVFKGSVTIVPARPDIFTDLPTPGPFGRARAFNVTNRVHTTEPFTVTTIQIRGGRRVPTVLRLYVTGVANTTSAVFSIKIDGVPPIQGTQVLTGGVLVEPGVYTVDFQLPAALNMAGDVPITVIINVAGTEFKSRLDDTAPRLFIL